MWDGGKGRQRFIRGLGAGGWGNNHPSVILGLLLSGLSRIQSTAVAKTTLTACTCLGLFLTTLCMVGSRDTPSPFGRPKNVVKMGKQTLRSCTRKDCVLAGTYWS